MVVSRWATCPLSPVLGSMRSQSRFAPWSLLRLRCVSPAIKALLTHLRLWILLSSSTRSKVRLLLSSMSMLKWRAHPQMIAVKTATCWDHSQDVASCLRVACRQHRHIDPAHRRLLTLSGHIHHAHNTLSLRPRTYQSRPYHLLCLATSIHVVYGGTALTSR